MSEPLTIEACPNCGAVFTLEEIEENYCGCCGWTPDQEPDDLDEFFNTGEDE